jgi:hypothetical protein
MIGDRRMGDKWRGGGAEGRGQSSEFRGWSEEGAVKRAE